MINDGSAASAANLQKQKIGGKMPASEVMNLFKKKRLHSGKGGKVVTNPHQAKAIQMSYARKEGADIPEKPSAGKRIMQYHSAQKAAKK